MPLNRLLFHGLGFWRLAGGLGGALLGWWLLFGGLQVWRVAEQNLIGKTDLSSPEFFIIHKPVPLVNLFGPAGVAFTEAEMAELRSQTFVKSLAPFQCNRFRAHADFAVDHTISALESELFFEAVPDEYLDLKPEGWRWEPGDTNLPIVISRDYLALYNFGFAQSQNLPQISDEMIKRLRFTVRVSGRGDEREFKGRIAGFSQRINTILAPAGFLEWANATFGEGQDRPSRLIVKADSSATPLLLKYFARQNYQYNTEQLRNARIGSAVRVLIGVVALFGLVVLGLAFWIFALSFQLIIAQNRDGLRKLVWLGYHPATLVQRYAALMLFLLLFINLSSLAFLYWGTGQIVGLLQTYGYPSDPVPLGGTLRWMVALSAVILGFNYFLLRKQIYRL